MKKAILATFILMCLSIQAAAIIQEKTINLEVAFIEADSRIWTLMNYELYYDDDLTGETYYAVNYISAENVMEWNCVDEEGCYPVNSEDLKEVCRIFLEDGPFVEVTEFNCDADLEDVLGGPTLIDEP